jgi:hypothetical protein
MSELNNPLDIIKRLDVKQNVTIRVIDEPTGKVVQEHVGHNAATNSLLTGIAHYLMGDGVLNQGADTLSMWVPQYISLGTMGLTSQESETLSDGSIVPKALGYTPVAPESATPTEKELNARLRFTEYLNQTPGFGADGYDDNSNNDREWFGLGYPYTLKPDALTQDFYNAGQTSYDLTSIPLTGDKNSIISVTVYPPTETQPNPVINQDIHDTSVTRQVISVEKYDVQMNGNNEYKLLLTDGASYQGRIAVIYTIDSADATNCELVKAKIENGSIVPLTLRSKISYRSLVPEFQSEVPNTLDVIYSAMVSTGALKDYRGDNDYVYITEAGLWSNSTYTDSGDNGLLAGYRLMPSDEEILPVATTQSFTGDGETKAFTFTQVATAIDAVTLNDVPTSAYNLDTETNQIVFDDAPADGVIIATTYTYTITDTWKDMKIPENREKVQKGILRVGINQVVQVVWKLQLGGLQQLNGLRYLYPSQYPEEVWELR